MVLANPASIADVTKRAFRTLSATETDSATELIDDAWYMLIGSAVGDKVLAALTVTSEHPTVDPVFKRNVVRILATSVVRVVHNPTGNLETEGDDYRERKDVAVSSGRLYISTDEIAELFPAEGTGNAFTIRPGRVNPLRPALPDDAFYTPMEY